MTREHVAIVRVHENRVAKMLDFDNADDAATHVAVHGGFVASAPNAPVSDWWVDGQTITVSPPMPTVGQLAAYADAKRDTVSDAGIVVNIGTEQTPVNVNADTTTAGRTDVLGLMQMAALGFPVTWYQSTGNIAITAEQLTTIALAIAAHRAESVAVHTVLWAGINATPATVTSYAQIDNAAWPT